MGIKVSETRIKQQVKEYLAIRHIFNYHLIQGVASYKGLPDRIMHYRGKVIYLEVKGPTGRMSEHQKVFQEQCQADGIPYWVVYSLDDLIKKLKEVKE